MGLAALRLGFDGRVIQRLAALVRNVRSNGAAIAPSGRALDDVRLAELRAGLLRQKEDLLALKGLLNAEFLEIGHNLREMAALARVVQRRAGEVVSLGSSGGGEGSAVHFSFHLLKKAEDLVQASYEQYEMLFRVFEELRSGLATLAKRRVGLARITAPLALITVQLRIQASALDEAKREQFHGLAKQVEQLVFEIRNEVEHRFEQLSVTERDSAALAERLSGELRQHKDRVQRTLQSSRQHLTALGDTLAQSDEVAQRVLAHSGKLSSTIAGVVMALQCDDMAAQRIQHLSLALDAMIGGLEGNGGSRDFVADTARIQLRQFEDLSDRLMAAAESIASGLSGVRSSAQEIAEVALQAGKSAGGGTVAQQSVKGMCEILSMLHLTLSTTESVAAAVAPLEHELSDCTTRLVSLALGARLVALNAQIFANRVEGGAALEVVADRIRMCSDEVLAELEQMSDIISGLAGGIRNVREQIADFRELGRAEQSILADEAQVTEANLQATEQRLRDSMAAIEASRRELSLLDARMTGEVRFPPALRDAKIKAVAVLQELAKVRQQSDAVGDEPDVDRLIGNYTMQHERDLHRLALAAAGTQAGDEPGQSPGQESAGKAVLADNVELFGDETVEHGRDLHLLAMAIGKSREPECSPAPAAEEEALGDNVELF